MRIDYNFYLIPHLHETFTTKTEEHSMPIQQNQENEQSWKGSKDSCWVWTSGVWQASVHL